MNMCALPLLLTWPLLFTLGASAIATSSNGGETNNKLDDHQETCSLYLAPSSQSTPGKIQLGLYAGRRYEASSIVGLPEVAIPIMDLEAHTARNVQTPEQKEKRKKEPHYLGLLAQYLWTPNPFGVQYESDENLGGPGRTYMAVPGVGMLSSFHGGLVNADWHDNSTLHRAVMVDAASAGMMGTAHPGRGAISENYNITIKATQTIPEGMEIFLNFGQDWSAKQLEKNPVPIQKDYESADASIEKIVQFFAKHEDEVSEEQKANMYNFLRNEVVELTSESEINANMTRELFPKSPDGLVGFQEAGGSLRHKNPDVFRDVAWLKAHGRCLDGIAVGPSTVDYAGRGAFATKRFGKGDVIAPIPLIQIGHRKELDFYELERRRDAAGEEHYYRKDEEPVSTQLLMNYCFGHSDSNMLLFPFGTASNFINHQSGEKANAKIIWSNLTEGMHQEKWLKLDPNVLSDKNHRNTGLMFDVVATRDIAPSEEIFIDYGDDWQAAWDAHKGKFHKAELNATSWPPTALELNDKYHRCDSGVGYAERFKTVDEIKQSPYPERIKTACLAIMNDIPENDKQREIEGVTVYDWAPNHETAWNGVSLRLCDVLERIEVKGDADRAGISYNYTVKVQLEIVSDASNELRVIRKVPHLAIRFIEKPYSSDTIRRDVKFPQFRHHIGIPDNIMPTAWKRK